MNDSRLYTCTDDDGYGESASANVIVTSSTVLEDSRKTSTASIQPTTEGVAPAETSPAQMASVLKDLQSVTKQLDDLKVILGCLTTIVIAAVIYLLAKVQIIAVSLARMNALAALPTSTPMVIRQSPVVPTRQPEQAEDPGEHRADHTHLGNSIQTRDVGEGFQDDVDDGFQDIHKERIPLNPSE